MTDETIAPAEDRGRSSVTINCDLGESYGNFGFGNDEDLLSIVDVAHVACGFHAGEPGTMATTVAAAVAAGVQIGAHPGLPDVIGFGRREMALTADEVRSSVLYQAGALVAFLEDAGGALTHIKPHGALYGMAARSAEVMEAICDVAQLYGVALYGLAGTTHEDVALRRGVAFVPELYVDVDYRDDGGLIVRRRPHRTPVERARRAAREALEQGLVTTVGGNRLPVRFTSICVHSDTPNAVDVARALRTVLDDVPTVHDHP